MNDKPKSRWYWRLLRWGLIGLAFLATLIAILVTEENWRGKHAWETYKRAAEASGEHLDMPSAVPPPVPDEQNFFAAPKIAELLKMERNGHAAGSSRSETDGIKRMDLYFYRGDVALTPTNGGGNWQKRTLTDLKPWQTYFRNYSLSPEGRTNGFPIAAQSQTPAADVLLALSEFDSTVDVLRQASQRPEARLPLNYDRWLENAGTLMPWLAVEKRWIQFVQLRTLAELQAGQGQASLDDVKLSLRLTDTLRDQPFLISHLVRIAMIDYIMQPIYEGIAQHRWNDAQLADLEVALGSEDLLADFQRAMRGERTCALFYFETLRRTREAESYVSANEIVTNSFRWVPSAYFYQNELAEARMYDQFILPLADLTNRTISFSTYRAGEQYLHQATNHYSPYRIQASMTLSSVSKSIMLFAWNQTHMDLVRVACALERHRLAHGEYPETLDALAPGLIQSMPHDIINGQPLHYRRTNDGGYVLYSVGWNETDDGGTVVLTKSGNVDRQKGDWVWQLPAK